METSEQTTASRAAPSFADVYTTYAKFMKRIAMGKFRLAAADADELVHDVFATYLGHASEDVTSVRAYLVIAICRAARRRTDRLRSEERLSIPTDQQEIPDAGTERSILLRMAVADALAVCSPRCRELLYRHHVHGESAEEIASSLSTTAQYVRQLLSDCRRRVREKSSGPGI
jgi:RNA polymerase sigma factor (sigma-70 family)